MEPNATSRFILIANPRTASNLLLRMLNLSNQDNLVFGENHGGYYFIPVIERIREIGVEMDLISEWSDEQVMQVKEVYEECFRNLESLLIKAEAEKRSVFIKEHAIFLTMLKSADTSSRFGAWTAASSDTTSTVSILLSSNPTFLPDEFMRSWKPTFLIRHPALAFPSLYRAMRDNNNSVLSDDRNHPNGFWKQRFTMEGMRALYDWYTQSSEYQSQSRSSKNLSIQWPIVMDADDIMTQPKLAQRYAELVGMDPSLVTHSWTATSEDKQLEITPRMRRMLDTLLASEGIDLKKVAGKVDLEEHAAIWRQEFGETAEKILRSFVQDAMPDYEYMKIRRLRA